MRLVPWFMGKGELSTWQVAHLFFENAIRPFGLPDEALHDRDSCFTAVFSSAYHSQTDGKAERAHRTIEQAVRCMLAEHSLLPDDWSKIIGI